MKWLEGELRKTGDVFDDMLAVQIADRRQEKGDIPFPSKEIPATRKFTKKAKSELRKRGKLIYELEGQSILSLREDQKPFFSKWHISSEELESMTSSLTEIALNPRALFIPESNGKTFDEQVELVKRYNDELNIPDVKAVIGEAPDYIELAFRHFDHSERRLFDNLYTVTETLLGDQRILVGHFIKDGLVVNNGFMSERERREQVFVAPIIVPA